MNNYEKGTIGSENRKTDDSKKRTISIETLKAIEPQINPILLYSIPEKLEEILPFAQRRTEPVITNNIDENLRSKMLDYRLSDEDYLLTLLMAMGDTFHNIERSNKPTALVLLAQTGAGKTHLRTLLLQKNPNTIIINSDLYKRFRPDAEAILESDPTHFGALTGIDSYDHASNITNFAIENSYDILIECAPSMQQGMIGVDLELLKSAGYDTKFHVMAVGDLISSLAIHLRYEHELAVEKIPGNAKLTDLKRHNESYLALENIIKDLPAQSVSIYRRGTEEENYTPVRVINEHKTPLEILADLRKKSNESYINTSGFKRDYNLIRNAMEYRSAPQSQQDQLKAIYDMYEKYIIER